MNAEIIAVGTELLLGQVINTNAAFLSKQLGGTGVDVFHHIVVGDNPDRLTAAIKDAEKRSDIIILSGGLGPTKDDLTKQVLAKHLEMELVLDQKTMDKIIERHNRRGKKMTENNKEQARVIKGSEVLKNSTGLAAGMFLERNNKLYILLPGPPSELEPMFNNEAMPLLLSYTDNGSKTILVSRVLRFFGIGESQLASILDDLIESQENPTLAPYAGLYEVTLRLTAKGSTQEICKQLLDELEEIVQQRVGEYFYGYGDDTRLVEVIEKLLIENGLTITAAESLTGGAFQSMLASISGVSEFFEGGLVTYSKSAKQKILGIQKETIEKYGVVSYQCAIEMAVRVKSLFNTDIGISFTGAAGPEGLEGKKPGTVWIGLALNDRKPFAVYCDFRRGRNANREQAVLTGFDLLRRELLGLEIPEKTFLSTQEL